MSQAEERQLETGREVVQGLLRSFSPIAVAADRVMAIAAARDWLETTAKEGGSDG